MQQTHHGFEQQNKKKKEIIIYNSLWQRTILNLLQKNNNPYFMFVACTSHSCIHDRLLWLYFSLRFIQMKWWRKRQQSDCKIMSSTATKREKKKKKKKLNEKEKLIIMLMWWIKRAKIIIIIIKTLTNTSYNDAMWFRLVISGEETTLLNFNGKLITL